MSEKNGAWDERKHPRDSDGKFTDGSGDTKPSKQTKEISDTVKKQRDTAQKKKEAPEEDDSPDMSSEPLWGDEHKGVKGAEAIDTLLREKKGHVKKAFHFEEVGDIAVLWGDKKGGLAHIIAQRDKLLAQGKGSISGIDMVKKIPEVMAKGELAKDEKGRICIQTDKYRIGINVEYFDKRINWIVTAMEILE